MRKLYTLLLVSAITTSLYANTGADSLSSDACVAEPAETMVFSMSFESGEGTVSIFPNPVKSFATISFTYENVDKISILNSKITWAIPLRSNSSYKLIMISG